MINVHGEIYMHIFIGTWLCSSESSDIGVDYGRSSPEKTNIASYVNTSCSA